jgi:DNA-3-methyladenine glycosylase I
MSEIRRCSWSGTDPIHVAYHDVEWGVPLHDDRSLFELLTLEGAQAGLSWLTVLRRRETYRRAFDLFDVDLVAHYDERKIAELLSNTGIVRNRLKVHSAITNAQALIRLRSQFDSFDRYLWGFVDGRPIQNSWRKKESVPTRSKQSDALSKDLVGRGFKFVGTTICYAFMQASGMVNDHLVDCFRYGKVTQR